MAEHRGEMRRETQVHVAHREHVRRVVLEAVVRMIGREPDRAARIDDIETDARVRARAKREAAQVDRATVICEHVTARVTERAAADAGNHQAGVVDLESARIERAKRGDLVANAGSCLRVREAAPSALATLRPSRSSSSGLRWKRVCPPHASHVPPGGTRLLLGASPCR